MYGERGRRLPGQRPALRRCSRAPRSSSPKRDRARRAVRRRPRARLAGRTGRRRCFARSPARWHAARAGGPGVHHSQPRVSGAVPARVVPALGLPWDVFRLDTGEFWGKFSFLKAGIAYARLRHDRQPDLRARDADARSSAAGMEGVLHALGDRVRRHSQRHRHRRLESGDRSVAAGAATTSHDLVGQASPASARCSSASGCQVGDDAIRRPLVGMVSRLVEQKGLDLVDAASDALLAMDATWVFVGTGEPRYEAVRCERWPSAHPSRVGVLHRLRRAARAPGRGRRRHVPDAVEVRAVRAESDVQPALRHGADRARGGRAGRHDSAVHVARASRQRVQVPERDRRGAGAHRPAGGPALSGPATSGVS